MKPVLQLTAGLLTGLLVAPITLATAQDEEAAPKASGQESQQEAATPAETGETAEAAAQKDAAATATDRHKEIIDEAVEALDETWKALEALEKEDTEAALDSLVVATGKLDLVVARNPLLALAPVDVRLVTHDIYAKVEDIEAAKKDALRFLEKGRVQDARALIEGLRSDLVVEVVNLPLATYPDAIKAITPLIDEGKLDAARAGLQAALNTVVVTQRVHPLPILRTEDMLARAEELAMIEDRDDEQNAELTQLLEDARAQLEFAQALGYGKKKDFKEFYGQLDEITKKTSGGKSGTGLFERIKKALRTFGDDDLPDAN